MVVDLMRARIDAFLAGSPHAVVGASADRAKYGNKVLRVYIQRGRPVYPVNPRAGQIEGLDAFASLAALPTRPHGLSIVTPPVVSEQVVEEAARLGIQHLWMQPGAESDRAVARAAELGLQLVAGGPCILLVLGYREQE